MSAGELSVRPSTSQTATTSPCLRQSSLSLSPLPLMPMQAKAIRWAGGFGGSLMGCFPGSPAPAPAATKYPIPIVAEVFKKLAAVLLLRHGGNSSGR